MHRTSSKNAIPLSSKFKRTSQRKPITNHLTQHIMNNFELMPEVQKWSDRRITIHMNIRPVHGVRKVRGNGSTGSPGDGAWEALLQSHKGAVGPVGSHRTSATCRWRRHVTQSRRVEFSYMSQVPFFASAPSLSADGGTLYTFFFPTNGDDGAKPCTHLHTGRQRSSCSQPLSMSNGQLARCVEVCLGWTKDQIVKID